MLLSFYIEWVAGTEVLDRIWSDDKHVARPGRLLENPGSKNINVLVIDKFLV